MAPAFIVLQINPDRYVVYASDLDGAAEPVVETTDSLDAATTTAELFAGWPTDR